MWAREETELIRPSNARQQRRQPGDHARHAEISWTGRCLRITPLDRDWRPLPGINSLGFGKRDGA
jgi:hypothetical protein